MSCASAGSRCGPRRAGHGDPPLAQRLRERLGGGRRRVRAAEAEAAAVAPLVDPQRGDRAHHVVGDVRRLPARVDRRAGEQRGVVGETDALAAEPVQRLGGGPGQGVQVGTGRVGAVRVGGVPPEQRVAAADEGDPGRGRGGHDLGDEPVVGAERLQRGGRGEHLQGGRRRDPGRAVPVDHGPVRELGDVDGDVLAEPLRLHEAGQRPSYGLGVDRGLVGGRGDRGGRRDLRQRQPGRRRHLGRLGDRRGVVEAEPAAAQVELVRRTGREQHQHDQAGRDAAQPPAASTAGGGVRRRDVACVTFRHPAPLSTPRFRRSCGTLSGFWERDGLDRPPQR